MPGSIRIDRHGGPEVLQWVDAGVGQSYALKDAAQAHRDLEARKAVGSTLLLP